jgi:Tfp pilus assembly protein PilO
MTFFRLNLIVIAIVFVLTLAFGAGLLVPGLKDWDRTCKDVAGRIDSVRAEQQKVGNVSELYASVLRMDAQLADFRKRLPEDRQFGEFLNDLSENLKRNQIQEYVIQPRPAVQLDEARLPPDLKLAKGMVILPVSVSFESSFTRLHEFLRSMEALPRVSHVESLKVLNDEQQPGQVNVELVLQTYHRPA